MIVITTNAYGQPNALGIGALLERLGSATLDPTFERYGNFIQHPLYHAKPSDTPGGWEDDTGRPMYPQSPGAHRFFGNFFDYSHCFSIDTDEPELIEVLTSAIRANQATAAYADAKRQVEEREAYWRSRAEQRRKKQLQEYRRNYGKDAA